MSIPDLNPLPSPPLPPQPNGQQEDSDGDLFTVPEVEQKVVEGGQRVRKGRNAAYREYRKLKRLLRNRVSAQQARERKKIYVTDLESRAKDLEDKNFHLEEKISTLINENTMLRKVLMNRRPKVDDESPDPQND